MKKQIAGIDVVDLDIEFYCNDDRPNIVIEIVDQDEAPFVFAGSTAKLQIKKRSSDTTAIKELSTSNSKIKLEDGSITLKFHKEVTSVAPGNYVYDLEVTSLAGITTTIIKGGIKALGDVTR